MAADDATNTTHLADHRLQLQDTIVCVARRGVPSSPPPSSSSSVSFQSQSQSQSQSPSKSMSPIPHSHGMSVVNCVSAMSSSQSISNQLNIINDTNNNNNNDDEDENDNDDELNLFRGDDPESMDNPEYRAWVDDLARRRADLLRELADSERAQQQSSTTTNNPLLSNRKHSTANGNNNNEDDDDEDYDDDDTSGAARRAAARYIAVEQRRRRFVFSRAARGTLPLGSPRVVPGVFTPQEMDTISNALRTTLLLRISNAAKNNTPTSAFRRFRHAAFPTVDLPVAELIDQNVARMIADRLQHRVLNGTDVVCAPPPPPPPPPTSQQQNQHQSLSSQHQHHQSSVCDSSGMNCDVTMQTVTKGGGFGFQPNDLYFVDLFFVYYSNRPALARRCIGMDTTDAEREMILSSRVLRGTMTGNYDDNYDNDNNSNDDGNRGDDDVTVAQISNTKGVQQQSGLALHADGALVSVNVALSNPETDFRGGGTFFPATGTIETPSRGDCLVHDSALMHAGEPIECGERLIIVGFAESVRPHSAASRG